MEKIDGILYDVTKKDIKLLENKPEEFWRGVTSVGKNAFYNRGKLTSINIPESVTSIEDGAFYGCINLASINIPESVRSIGIFAFYGCKNLASINIPKGVTSIGRGTFRACDNLTSINIPEGVTSIEAAAFYDCKNLTNITIPEGVASIGQYTFYGCEKLTNIIIPEGVTSVGNYAFSGCRSLINVTIPESVTNIDEYAFNDCEKLTSINIPECVTSIGWGAFSDCRSLTSVSIPEGVTSVDNYAFYGVKNVNIRGKNIHGDLITPEIFDLIKSNEDINFKQLNKIYLLAKEKGLDENNLREFIALSVNLGILEDPSTTIEKGKDKNGKPILAPVRDIAYTFLQGVINNGSLQLDALHTDIQAMKMDGYNEEFAKFVTNKTNWEDIRENMGYLPRVYDWFKDRTELDISQGTDNFLLPTVEENRFKVNVFETSVNGVDRTYWRTPTMKYLIKEFAETKFTGIVTARDRELAEYISKNPNYQQKHFDKAKEIDKEREGLGVKDILSKEIKQGRIESLDEYRSKTQELQAQILAESAEILSNEVEDTSSVFTYEVLSKSDPANFLMGQLTDCCAVLYGAGAGAMRGMIIHPDMQPLVIRDFDNRIVSFGIIYVNREAGYAVVNDFEVNGRYSDYTKRKGIYEKAMQGVEAFVLEYNAENPDNPIKRVTCGLSPNTGERINDFIAQNPESETLKAPNFNDFNYAGTSGAWSGDWHGKQYEIWNINKGRSK